MQIAGEPSVRLVLNPATGAVLETVVKSNERVESKHILVTSNTATATVVAAQGVVDSVNAVPPGAAWIAAPASVKPVTIAISPTVGSPTTTLRTSSADRGGKPNTSGKKRFFHLPLSVRLSGPVGPRCRTQQHPWSPSRAQPAVTVRGRTPATVALTPRGAALAHDGVQRAGCWVDVLPGDGAPGSPFTQLSALLDGSGISATSVVQVLLMFGVLWWMYGGYAWLTNTRTPDRTPERLLLLVGMAGFLVVGLAIPRGFGRGGSAPTGLTLGLGYLVVVWCIAGCITG